MPPSRLRDRPRVPPGWPDPTAFDRCRQRRYAALLAFSLLATALIAGAALWLRSPAACAAIAAWLR